MDTPSFTAAVIVRRYAGLLMLSFPVSIFSGCADDAEPPRVETPAIVGVATGDVTSRKDYADAVEANNKRNAERGSRGDWSYVKPAVGPKD